MRHKRNSAEPVSLFYGEVLRSQNSVAMTSMKPVDHISLIAQALYEWLRRSDRPECVFTARGPAGRADVDLQAAVDQDDIARLMRQAFGRTRTA